MKLYSNKIRAFCKEKQITQTDFAKGIGMTQAAVSKMLRNEATTEVFAQRIADFLSVPLGDISYLNTGVNPDNIKSTRVIVLEKKVENLEQRLTDINAELKKKEDMITMQTEIIRNLSSRK